MRVLILVSCLAAVFAAKISGKKISKEQLKSQWYSFKQQYSKSYASSEEEFTHYQSFVKNSMNILQHNEEYANEMHSYSLGINKYSDMDISEIRSKMNGFLGSNAPRNSSRYLSPSFVQIPDTVDWRTKGYVTPVKDQGQCGSCWAFSSTGSLEGQHFRATGNLVSLSEQNLVDCTRDYGNFGCGGGWMDNAFKYVEFNGGIDTEKSYPYDAEDEKCHYRKETRGATDTGFVDIPEGDEQALKEAVATAGPVSIAIDASHASFQSYQSGVYIEPRCNSTLLDHGVLIVGYGTEDTLDYWLVKNSWGESWGDEGYIKMGRNMDNQCGVASKASYPLV